MFGCGYQMLWTHKVTGAQPKAMPDVSKDSTHQDVACLLVRRGIIGSCFLVKIINSTRQTWEGVRIELTCFWETLMFKSSTQACFIESGTVRAIRWECFICSHIMPYNWAWVNTHKYRVAMGRYLGGPLGFHGGHHGPKLAGAEKGRCGSGGGWSDGTGVPG